MWYKLAVLVIFIGFLAPNLVTAQINFGNYNEEFAEPRLRLISSPTRKVQVQPKINISPRLLSLCPENIPQTLYRFHNETNMCYRIGTRGPCNKGMLFLYIDDQFGQCDCEFGERAFVYHEKTERCYPIFSQAYCKVGQWLLLDRNSFKPFCIRNLCFGRGNDPNVELIPFKGHCVEIESKSKHCRDDEVVTFVKDEVDPICGPRSDAIFPSKFIPKVRCAPGSVYSITGQCDPVFRWF